MAFLACSVSNGMSLQVTIAGSLPILFTEVERK
jgi:hypothetical protein